MNTMSIKDNKKVVFKDSLLQVKIGQWLGILPSTVECKTFLGRYRTFKSAEEFLENSQISQAQAIQIEQGFVDLLQLFNLKDSQYIIQDFNNIDNTFSCYLVDSLEKVDIKLNLGQNVLYPSQFEVYRKGIKTQYQFVKVPDGHHKLVSIKTEMDNDIVMLSDLDYYLLNKSNSLFIKIDYLNRLNDLQEQKNMINHEQLVQSLKNSDITEYEFLDICHMVKTCFKQDITNYANIQIELGNIGNDKKCKSELVMKNGQIQNFKLFNKPVSYDKWLEVQTMFNCPNSCTMRQK